MDNLLETISSSIETVVITFVQCLTSLFPFLPQTPQENPEIIMIIIGFGGQALFGARFIVQWIVSEKVQQSMIPIAFWYCSVFGGLTLLTYALWRKDIVIICGQCLGLFIYLRNLHLIYKRRNA